MTDSGKDRDATPGQPRPAAGDELLPPVEPPSARFIIQLFIVPALIVMVIVAVWLLFSSLVRRSSPETVLQGLEYGPSIARWQRASELADMLRNERFLEFRHSAEAAQHVARILDREIEQAGGEAGSSEEEVTLRYFLARALGEFDVEEGIDVLLKAAETRRDAREALVQQGALEAIAVRAFNLRQHDPPLVLSDPSILKTLSQLANDEDPATRSKTAFALGQIRTPEALQRLEAMVDDPDPDTRYNAAVALAHQGNARGAESLAEMLDIEEPSGVQNESDERSRAIKRAAIVATALDAAQALAQKNSQTTDLSPVTKALERLAAADSAALEAAHLPQRVAADAQRVLNSLKSR